MNLCSDKHEEICFEGRTCPACDQIAKRNSEIKEKDDEIKSLQAELRQLEAQIENWENEPVLPAIAQAQLKG